MWFEVSWDSRVGIETCYGLDGLGTELQWGETFQKRPDRPRGPQSLLYGGYRVFFPKVKQPGCDTDHPPTPSAKVNERVQLHL
jgi:hypothetical protein